MWVHCMMYCMMHCMMGALWITAGVGAARHPCQTCNKVLQYLRQQLDDLGVAQGGQGYRGAREKKVSSQDCHLGEVLLKKHACIEYVNTVVCKHACIEYVNTLVSSM